MKRWRNEFTRRDLNNRWDQNYDGIHSGSFINQKIGRNAFVTNALESSKDNEHYFGSAKKHVRLIMRGLSGSAGNNENLTGSIFALTGAVGVELSSSWFDANNASIASDFIINFGLETTTLETKHEALMLFYASASNEEFNLSSISVQFKDGVGIGADVGKYIDVILTGTNIIEEADKWRRFEFRFVDNFGSIIYPQLRFTSGSTYWRVSSSSGKTYAFRDFQVIWDQKLTNDGVKVYRGLDNTNSKVGEYFRYINRNVMPKVE